MPTTTTINETMTDSVSHYNDARMVYESNRARLVEFAARHPYLTRDLVDAGLPAAAARTILATARQSALWTDPDYVAARPQETLSPTVAGVVPSDEEVALRMMREFGVYLRLTSFSERQQLRNGISYLATDSRQRLQHVYPIVARYTIGSGAAVAGATAEPGMSEVAAYLRSRDMDWAEPADVMILGERCDIDMPLGYANRGGVPGVRHVLFEVLKGADQYKGVPSA